MSSDRITVRLPRALTERLRARSRVHGTSESQLVRQALEGYLNRTKEKRSAYELAEAAGVIGVARNAPVDLSTNPRHFRGFGRRK
jgi:metal-responsive CopG/Arc/MetJ family transcriptional regulator